MIPAVLVHFDELWQTIWVASIAGVGVCTAFAVVVLGASRSGEARRAGRGGAGVAYAALGLAGLVVTVGAAVAGLLLIAS